jgi:serine/threonine protein kinase
MNDLPTDRDPIDVLAEEFVARYRRGEGPSIEEYARRYPDLAGDIHALFPAATLLEDLKGPPPAPAAGPVPTRLGDFRLIREIGRGGMGIVYEAEQVSLGRRVALKVLPAHPPLGPDRLERFRREARAAGRLHHTNIVPVFGVGEHEGLHYYVMQLIPGQGVDRLLARVRDQHDRPAAARTHVLPGRPAGLAEPTAPHAGDFPPETGPIPTAPGDVPSFPSFGDPDYFRCVARLSAQVADALAYAHGHGVLHRDIKPANLLVDGRGSVWVTDFGLAKLIEHDDLTRPGEMAGTLRYSAPERFQGKSDPRTDLYSLGLTLYELLTLHPAYEEPDPGKLLLLVTQGQVPRPRSRNPAVPRDLETICLKCLAPEPGRRYASAGELADDLRRFLDDRPVRARRASPIERAARWCRRNPAVAGLSAALALVFAVGFAGVVWKWREASANLDQAGQALVRVEEERGRAEGNLDLALEAFERIARQLGPGGWSGGGLDADGDEVAAAPVVTPEAAAVLEGMVRFYERFAENNTNDPRLKRDTARALRQVGAIRLRLGQYRQAAQALERSAALLGDDPDRWLERARTHNDLGVALRSSGRLPAAWREHATALALLPTGETAPARARLERARACNLRGAVEVRQLRLPDAEASQRAALGLLGGLIEEDKKHPDYRHLFARATHDLAVVLRMQERRGEVAPLWAQALEALEKLAGDFPSVPDYRAELAEMLLVFQPRPPGAFRTPGEVNERLERAVALAVELNGKYPAVPEYQLLLARARTRLGQAQLFQRKTDAAIANLRQSVALHRSLAARSTNLPAARLSWLEARLLLGEALQRRQPDESVRQLRDAMDDLTKFTTAMPRNRFARSLLARACRALAGVLERQGKKEEAQELARKAAELGVKRP